MKGKTLIFVTQELRFEKKKNYSDFKVVVYLKIEQNFFHIFNKLIYTIFLNIVNIPIQNCKATLVKKIYFWKSLAFLTLQNLRSSFYQKPQMINRTLA